MFEQMKQWMTPDRAMAMQGIGLGLSQLDAGQPVNLSPVYAALEQRKQAEQMGKVMEVPGILDSFSPQQRAALAAMPPQLATEIIMAQAFKAQEPVAGINVGGSLVNPYTGEVMYSAPAQADPVQMDTFTGPDGTVYKFNPVTGAAEPLTGPEQNGGQDIPASFAALDMQAQAAGLVPGSPEYQQFMMNGGGSGTPAAFTALDMQARAAGFEPGTPQYQEFMATRGSGFAAEATAKGKAEGEKAASAETQISNGEIALQGIEEIRKHPGMGTGTGFSAMGNFIPGTEGYAFQTRVDQLAGGAFLTAIQQLQGMGALSNSEGQTATAALARLNTGLSEAEFMDALSDYEAIVKKGMERARGNMAKSDAAPAEKTRLKFNPATGELE